MVKLISVYDFAIVWVFVVFFQLLFTYIYLNIKKKYFINDTHDFCEEDLKRFFLGLNVGWFLFYNNFLVIFILLFGLYFFNTFLKYKFKKESKILPEILFGLFSIILLIYL